MIRIAIADDHPIVLDGLQALFETCGDISVVARCTDGAEALAAARRHRPDVLLLDYRMPGMDGVETLRSIREDGLPCRVVLLAADIPIEKALEAVRLDVDGLLLKELAAELLVSGVRRVAAGERWFEKDLSGRLVDALLQRDGRTGASPAGAAATLTPRERQLARLAAMGLRNRDIARRLRIREGTVKVHLHNVYRKLAVRDRVELVLHARAKGID